MIDKTACIILAAGKGTRLKAKKKNKLVSIAKKTAPIGAAAAVGEAYGRHRSKK